MSFASRPTSLQAYNLLLYRTALHPEFFRIEGRRRIRHGDYEFETWLLEGGHAFRFEHDGTCATEVVTDLPLEQLPDRGLVTAMPCAGEKDHESEVADCIVYVSSMQTETLTDHLYLGTHDEMVEHARENDSLVWMWSDDVGKANLSLIDLQRFHDQVHVQAYHLRSDCGLVLRTQSIFQLKQQRG